jgi:hypothetical protein
MDTTDSVSRHQAPNATSAARAASAAAIVSVRGKSRRVAAAAAAATVIVGSTMAALTPISVADTPDARGKSPQTVQVSGQLVPLDAMGSTYKLSGALIGTWTFPPVDITYYQSDTRIYTRGTESFEGCVNLNGDDNCDRSEPSGRWQGDYMYWASYNRNGRLVEGGCTHMLTGGTKAFTGVRGLFHMTDVYATTPAGSTAIYQGEVVLNAVKEAPAAKPASTGPAAATSTGGGPAAC